MRFRKRPVVVQAVQLTWTTWNEMCEHAGVGRLEDGRPQGGWVAPDGSFHGQPLDLGDVPGALGLAEMDRRGWKMALAIPTLEGTMVATEGDWIIRGVAGELYPCKPDVFAATYESAGDVGGLR